MAYKDIIKVRFLKNGEPVGREYAYFSPVLVGVGEIVELEARDGVTTGVVTQVNVPEKEIAPFKDRAKSILGKVRKTTFKQEVEKLLGYTAEEKIFTDAEEHAKRKLEIARKNNPEEKYSEFYRAMLTADCYREILFSNYTMGKCKTISTSKEEAK